MPVELCVHRYAYGCPYCAQPPDQARITAIAELEGKREPINIRPVMTHEQAIDLAVRRAAERLAAQQGTAPRRILNYVLADGAPATANMKWIPSPGVQTDAYFCPADLLLYGGQGGGGKSSLLLGLALTAASPLAHHAPAVHRPRRAHRRGDPLQRHARRLQRLAPPKLRTADGG
jgi:hypothetical protein